MAQRWDSRWLILYFLAISAVTFWLYRHDKRQAQSEGWRTPESTLHLVELLGGWPAAFLGQRLFRHKTSKLSYQIIFWAIIVIYQIVSFEFVYDWKDIRSAWAMFRP